jgi:glycosyltransferase involved in cell wall biosynthesis
MGHAGQRPGLHILMLSDVYFPRINGVSTSIQTFRRELAQLGHRVTLVAPDYPAQAHDEGDIQRVVSHRVPFDPEDRLMARHALLAALRALAPSGVDLVHIQTPFLAHYAGVAFARELGVPCLETYHTYFEEYLFHYVPLVPRAWMRAAARRFSRRQCNSLDAVVVPSRAMLQVLKAYGVTTAMHVIPTGLELARWQGGDGAAFRRRHAIPASRPVLVHVGRLALEKNIDFLLRVVARVRSRIPDVLLIVSGDGPARAGLEALSRRLGLPANVLFVGYLDRRSVLLDCYRAGDAFVFASNTETQGLVLLEAMALGVPVVSTAVLGTTDILHNAQGALIAREDEADFADKVVRVLEDGALRARLACAAREDVAHWSAAAMARAMADLYWSLLEARSRGRPACGASAGRLAEERTGGHLPP